jgi:hypothetical protein
VDLAILGAAALSLFLELAVIRWQAAVFEFFAFYKNVGLLSCFAGLGLGYALAHRERIMLQFTIPLLSLQITLLLAIRYSFAERNLVAIRELPIVEQLGMGISRFSSMYQAVAVYFFLSVVFLLTVLAFMPVGQVCGRLMERKEKLPAYGLNLLGSVFGVLLVFLVSAFWTPPLVWFAICFAGSLFFYTRKVSPLLLGAGFAILGFIALAWPMDPLSNRVYSPYQLLEFRPSKRGLLEMRAAGAYYQRVNDLSDRATSGDLGLKKIRDYYELPYRIHGKFGEVAIVGSGTGNDVAAALRAGAQRVDAIEIDPAILSAGKAYHPEYPYSDPRVRSIVNDARTFLRTTRETYDMVVYGMLDSHSLLSHASSVRLDSFVYTLEGLREARARLKEDGVLCLSYSVINQNLGRKIYLMMQQAFDGRPPVCIRAKYDGAVVFMQGNTGDVVVPSQWLQERGFTDITQVYASPEFEADVSTDDWPFFYMPTRVYPVSYLLMLGFVLFLTLFVTHNFLPEKTSFGNAPFFFLGAGFMLIETKGITEMGLVFGNTWQVIGIVIVGILVMAFLANYCVQRMAIRKPGVPYLLLMASLGIGWFVAKSGGFPSTGLGRLATVVVLTGPLFFSGIVFSTLLRRGGAISGIMGVNLLGAMLGGLLEYNSMYFGFQFLYLIAGGCYLLAMLTAIFRTSPTAAEPAPEPLPP